VKTRKQIIIRVAAVVAITACSTMGSFAQSLISKVDQYMNDEIREKDFGAAVLIARDGKILVSKGYGLANRELDVPVTPQTKFRIGSMTKQFTAVSIMLLQERGKLSVKDSVCMYVKPCPEAWKDVTIHHLLTHTSGIPDLLRFPEFSQTMTLPSPVDRTIERFKNKPLEFKPGEKWDYSNSGYILLGYIVEQVSGKSYEDFVRENIFEPLKMSNSGIDRHDTIIRNRADGYAFEKGVIVNARYIDMSIPAGAGALYSTVEDLGLWDEALYTEKLLSKKSLDAIFTPYVKTPFGDSGGYGWYIGKDEANHRVVGHSGRINGFSCEATRFPDQHVFIAVFCNKSGVEVEKIIPRLAAIVFAEDNNGSSVK
jgi:CubicO group peptidase (beta-lactamase class C family)